VDGVGLGELAGGPCEVADLAGVDDGDGEAGRGELGGRRALDAAGGFEDDEGSPVAERDELDESAVVVGEAKEVAAGGGDVEGVERDVDADVEVGHGSARLGGACGVPALQIRARDAVGDDVPCGPGNCSGSEQDERGALATVRPHGPREVRAAALGSNIQGGHERAPWSSWPREAQRVLGEVAEAERHAIHRAAEAVADGADVTPELVAEVIRSYRGLLREDGADRLPAVGGYPEGDEDDDGAPPERIVVEDLDILDGQEGADAPTTPRRRGVPHVTNPAGERELSLYLPAVACPEALRAEGEPTRPVVAP